MPLIPQDVTDTELAILQVLWDQGASTRPQIAGVLYPGGGPSHYATVQKLLERLETKGYVTHQRREGVLRFTAVLGRDELLGRRLQDLAAKMCGGALTPVLLHFVRSGPLTTAELDELRAVIDQRRRQAKPKGKRR
jgi:BlaI family transcriptional regulator, penicillinase repressor